MIGKNLKININDISEFPEIEKYVHECIHKSSEMKNLHTYIGKLLLENKLDRRANILVELLPIQDYNTNIDEKELTELGSADSE